MLSISEIYHKYTDQDPTRIFQDGALKSAMIVFSFIGITALFDIDRNLVIISILFMANLAASILMGSVQARRLAFYLYMIFAISVINVSPYVHPFFEKNFMTIVIVVFVAFLVRRFGEAYKVFPLMIVVVTCICFERYPLSTYNHIDFTLTAILLGLIFYILIIRKYKLIDSNGISKIFNDFVKNFVRVYIDTFEKSKFRRFTQSDIVEVSNLKYESINSFKIHGLMFLKKSLQDRWRYLSHNLVIYNRLTSKFLLTYKKLAIDYIRLGFDEIEAKSLSQDLNKIYKKTMFLMLYTEKSNDVFERKVLEISHLKYKFEMNYIHKYQKDKQKRKLLFNSLLLLDDMLISLENIREAYYDLI